MSNNLDDESNIELHEFVTADDAGKVITMHFAGFDAPGDYSFKTVNNFVHDAGREFEELQYLCLGLAKELDRWKQVADDAAVANTKDEACAIVEKSLEIR